MHRVTPHVEHRPDGTDFVAPYPGREGESRYAFEARAAGHCVMSTVVANDGSWAAEIHWPDVMAEQLTLPPAHGTWRREEGRWVPHDPKDPAQAAKLVQEVSDPPEVAHAKSKALEARVAALEARLAGAQAGAGPAAPNPPGM